MSSIFRLACLLLLVFPVTAAAQSQLPPCPSDTRAYRHNCFGALTFSSGSRYVGEFKDGKYHGQGTFTWNSGRRYVGEFQSDMLQGQGIEYGADGAIRRSGRWLNGELAQSFAIDRSRFAVDGSTPVAGPFADSGRAERDRLAAAAQARLPPCPSDVRAYWHDCVGTMTFPSGNKYVGEFKDSKYNGQGTFTFANGEKYVGEFKDGQRNGQGIEYRADGVVGRSGLWTDGRFAQSYSLDRSRFPFSSAQEQAELEAKRKTERAAEDARNLAARLNSNSLGRLPWRERLDRVVQSELRDWLTPDVKALEEVPPPAYPAALSLKQEVWETNREFESRVELARAERSRAIDRLLSEYRLRVEGRNRRVAEYNKVRQEREAKLVERRRELILLGIGVIAPTASLSDVALNQQTGDLTIASVIEGLEKQVFSFSGTTQAFRRAALTEPKAIKVNAEFQVSDSGEVVVAALNVEAGGVSARGLPSTSSATPMQLAAVTIASTPAPVIAQQSAVTVDRNQVEQILYREENESLRKRLEDQRRQQEQALANAEARAATEIARIRAEADAERKKLAEARPVQNIVSVQEAHALVIGNSAYRAASRLANPVNDAAAMSTKLRSMGFKVTEISNASREQMVRGLSEFSKTAARADLTLLFYAGHGVQIQGINYMVPVDMSLSDPSQATLQAVSLTQVVEQYLPGKTKLVFLDACRDNPLMNSGLRGVARGLAPISVSEGTLISYATKDGQTAEDGVGSRNSPFTTALLEHLGDPNDIAVVLRKVREKVMQATGGKQQPWEYGSLTGGELVLSAIRGVGR